MKFTQVKAKLLSKQVTLYCYICVRITHVLDEVHAAQGHLQAAVKTGHATIYVSSCCCVYVRIARIPDDVDAAQGRTLLSKKKKGLLKP
jgi:hypothetical protein